MKFIEFIKNRRVVVWGLGLNQGGLEAAKYFAELGAAVVVVDLKTETELEESISVLRKFSNVVFNLGKQEEADFDGADMVIKNPAIPWENPLVKKLLKKGIRVETDITLFFRFFQGKAVGITGSKGKTTTTILIAEFLKKAERDVILGGNIRVSLFSYLNKETLESKNKIAVLELSSFQLEDLMFIQKSPNVAVVTNILRDHLNRYGSYKKYIKAKTGICRFQKKSDFLVLNKKDKKAEEFEKCSEAEVVWLSSPETITANPVFFSKNNQLNLAAALAVAKMFKVKKNILEKVVKDFKGVPYRLEKIATVNSVTFYNDTAATIPDAAINNLKSFDRKVILISGGADKNLKFTDFAKAVAMKAKRIILLPGTATPLIEKSLTRYAPHTTRDNAASMDKAVKKAYKSACVGDMVLLSPGCASFGLFKNEFDRGDRFNEAVRKLKNEIEKRRASTPEYRIK